MMPDHSTESVGSDSAVHAQPQNCSGASVSTGGAETPGGKVFMPGTSGGTKSLDLGEAPPPSGPVMRSEPRMTFGGMTQARWAIKRRKVVSDLQHRWIEATHHMNSPRFAMYADSFVGQIRRWMPDFREVPCEQVLSGVLQLLRDALTGQNFTRLEEHELHDVILRVLQLPSVAKEETLSMLAFDEAHTLLLEAGLLC